MTVLMNLRREPGHPIKYAFEYNLKETQGKKLSDFCYADLTSLFNFSSGKSNGDPDCDPPPLAPAQSGVEEISPEIKNKIEEEAYNKG